jgi:hypothetical protein
MLENSESKITDNTKKLKEEMQWKKKGQENW